MWFEVITKKAQKKLFENLIETYENRAKRYFDDKLDSNGFLIKWINIDLDIKEILVDMAYRGDLKQKIVDNVLDLVSQNDKPNLAKFVGNSTSFKGVVSTLPDNNRCNQRQEKLS